MEELSKLGSKVRFETNQETNKRSDGHVLDSYIMLFLSNGDRLVCDSRTCVVEHSIHIGTVL